MSKKSSGLYVGFNSLDFGDPLGLGELQDPDANFETDWNLSHIPVPEERMDVDEFTHDDLPKPVTGHESKIFVPDFTKTYPNERTEKVQIRGHWVQTITMQNRHKRNKTKLVLCG
jgi:hypothetical protein